MKVKRKDLLSVWSVLESIKQARTNIRTTYNIAKNRNIILPEIEAIQVAMKLEGTLETYENARLELCKKYAQKDDYDNPIIDNGTFILDATGRRGFDDEFAKLSAEMPDAIEKAKEHELQITALIDGEVEVSLVPFQLDNIPDDLFSVIQLEVLDKCGLITTED